MIYRLSIRSCTAFYGYDAFSLRTRTQLQTGRRVPSPTAEQSSFYLLIASRRLPEPDVFVLRLSACSFVRRGGEQRLYGHIYNNTVWWLRTRGPTDQKAKTLAQADIFYRLGE